jgi:acyl transferase domain-containing protein
MAGATVFMFSGQGSHYYQMGKGLFDGDPTFREWMRRLDESARPSVGTSVVEALYASAHSKAEPFERTLLTHPAIFMVEYALAQSLARAGVRADMVLGASMGAFAAAAFAGILDVEDALAAVVRQATALEQGCEAGGMTAVLADPALFAEDFIGGRGELAAVNFASHFVVSARRRDLEEIEVALTRRGVGFQRLAVSLPFHSRWMDGARAPFEEFMGRVRRRPGKLPLMCCERASALDGLPDGYFWDVVRRPIRFRETLACLEQGGARRYVDVGPAGTLATFVKYGLSATSASVARAVLTPYGRDLQSFSSAVAALAH